MEDGGFRAQNEARPFPQTDGDDADDEREKDGGDHRVEVLVLDLPAGGDGGFQRGVAFRLGERGGLFRGCELRGGGSGFDEFVFCADGGEAGGTGEVGGFFRGGHGDLFELLGFGEKADGGTGVIDFLQARGAGDREQPDERQERDEDERGVAAVAQLQLQQDRGGEAERDAGEELVGDAKDGP